MEWTPLMTDAFTMGFAFPVTAGVLVYSVQVVKILLKQITRYE